MIIVKTFIWWVLKFAMLAYTKHTKIYISQYLTLHNLTGV